MPDRCAWRARRKTHQPSKEVWMLRKFRRRFSPSMIVALIALLFATGTGSAIAAKSLINGKDIKRGSIPANRLTKGAQEKFTKATKGERGPVGPAGAQGPAGPVGPAG